MSSDVRQDVLRCHIPVNARNSRDVFNPGDKAPGIFRVIKGRVDMVAISDQLLIV